MNNSFQHYETFDKDVDTRDIFRRAFQVWNTAVEVNPGLKDEHIWITVEDKDGKQHLSVATDNKTSKLPPLIWVLVAIWFIWVAASVAKDMLG